MRTVIELKKLQTEYENIVNAPVLEGCNTIVEVGDFYTVGTDEEGRTILENRHFPTQFSPKAAQQIVNECVFRDGSNNPVKAVAVPVKQWYRQRIENVNTLLKVL